MEAALVTAEKIAAIGSVTESSVTREITLALESTTLIDVTGSITHATHEITLHGHSLRRIETTMQRMELSLLMALPGNQRALVAEGQPVVHEIVVTEAENQQMRPPSGSE